MPPKHSGVIRSLGHSFALVRSFGQSLTMDHSVCDQVSKLPPNHSGVIRTLGHSFALVRSFGHSWTSQRVIHSLLFALSVIHGRVNDQLHWCVNDWIIRSVIK
jgi:hypothetical protein